MLGHTIALYKTNSILGKGNLLLSHTWIRGFEDIRESSRDCWEADLVSTHSYYLAR
jgi:hypothetical protein